MRVGSAHPCQVLISAKGVLGVHFFFKCGGGRVALIVQDEKANVLLNGAVTRKKLLESGDSIQAGEAVLVLEAVQRDPLLGHTVGGYRIDAFIGRGAMGTVYKATQLSLERTVALKILSPELTRDAAFVAKFLEEAKAAAKLNHPNVVQIYDAAAALAPGAAGEVKAPNGDAEAQLFFFSMEHMPGGTLQKLLDKEGKVSLVRALAIGCDTAKALVWAEEHGIVHRDIKPANLLFAADGSVKVADLGIAADIDRMMEGVEGLQGAGSPRYMAPEQAQRKGVDHRADLYALGSTLFRAIAARHVFEGKTAADVIKAKTTEDPPRLDVVAPEVPTEVADLLGKMLSRELSGRPRTCADALLALEECLASARADAEAEADDDGAAPNASPRGSTARQKHKARARDAAEEGGWNEFIASAAGKVSLSVSAMLLILSIAWPVTTSSPDPGAGGPIASGAQGGAAQRPGAPAVRVRDEAGGGTTQPDVPLKTPGKDPPLKSAAASLVDPVLSELGRILTEYRSGLSDAKRALAALEDFKRKHPEPIYADRAGIQLNQIRDGLTEAGKSVLARFVSGDLRGLLEQQEYREAIGRLVKLGELHPVILKEINDQIAKVEDAVRADLKKVEDDANKAADLGDFSGAIAALKKVEAILPINIQTPVTEKIARLVKDQKEYAELSGPFAKQAEGVEDAITALDFSRASTQAAALPKPANALLAKRRAAIVADVQLCRSAWDALSAAAGGTGAKTEPKALLSSAPKDLLSLLGGSPPAGQIEGLGLLLLYAHGPDRARDLLLDPRLGAQKLAAYKVRLAEEEDAYLSRYARRMMARMDELKSGGSDAQADWPGLAEECLRKITASRSSRGYEKARSDLAKAFLRSKAEVLRAAAPASLFRGKVKSYKPDGSIELNYEFASEEDFKDFVPIRSSGSRLELESKMAKMRGEFRLGRGDVFRNRLGVTGKLPANGYSPQSPNINVALWTRDDDRVSAAQKETPQEQGGVPHDYFAFGFGYKARLPAGSATDALTVKGSSALVTLPAGAIFGGVRGAALHSRLEGDCFWAKPAGKLSGPQTFHIVMSSGALSWTVNTRSMLTARDVKDLEILKREEPYTGSVTFFTYSDVLFYDSILIEGELNPPWIEEQLITLAEVELKKVEPDYPFPK